MLCSDLTEKTKFSFISSNSSFSECVRQYHLIQYNIFNQKNDNPSCPASQIVSGRCKYFQIRPSLSGSGLYIFTDTDFLHCEVTGNSCFGGAIDCRTGDLTIQRCSFASCYSEFRGGAVSFQSSRLCTQEDNLYAECWSDDSSGAFDSWDTSKYPHHSHKRCKYIDSHSTYYAHFAIEYSPDAMIESNIYIHGRSDGTYYAGSVVNFQAQGAIVYSNSLFVDGEASNSGGLSFLGFYTSDSATLSVKFCFFLNNFGADDTAREIYFNGDTSRNAREDLIIHSFSATPGSTVFIQNKSPQDKDWLPFAYL